MSSNIPTEPGIDHLSIVIPVYNEENGIGDTLDDLLQFIEEWSLADVEIIVVNDGSTDGTQDILAQYDTQLRSVTHPVNRGYGAALKTGISHATHDIVCITDADGTYPNERIIDLLNVMRASGVDMVVGARTGETVSIPLIRRPAKWFIRWLAIYVVQQHIPDLNSGLRIFHKSMALAFKKLLPDQFSFTTTITLAAIVNGYQVTYLPINYFHRVGNSKIRPIQDTLNFIQLVAKIALYFAPLRIFIPLSAIIFLIGIGWGVYSLTVLGQLADASMLVLVMSAIQIGVLGLLAELINHRS